MIFSCPAAQGSSAYAHYFPRIRFSNDQPSSKSGMHHVGAHAEQPFAFPLVEAPGAIVGFVAGDGHGQSANFFGVLDLAVAVAKGKQPLRPGCRFSANIRSMTFFFENCL